MNIKEIVDQEKQRELARKSQLKQDKHIKTLFLKDCYKMWKDYKKVEKPYTWWLGIFSIWNILIGGCNYFYELWNLPEAYLKDSWFFNKWEVVDDELGQIMIKHRTNPKNEHVYL